MRLTWYCSAMPDIVSPARTVCTVGLVALGGFGVGFAGVAGGVVGAVGARGHEQALADVEEGAAPGQPVLGHEGRDRRAVRDGEVPERVTRPAP